MSNRRLLFTCVLTISLMVVGNAAETPTNFVIIMADDLGYGDISCFGNPGYQTPHLDQLAAEGLKLTDFHSNGAVCSPTRAALMTGRYQQRAGLDGVIFADPKQNRHHGLATEETTLADAMASAGYVTGAFGKWHLGYDVQFNPTRNGFDQFVGYVSGNVCYKAHLDRMGIFDWWHDDELNREPGYVTHLITDYAVKFIEQHQKQPFCLYVAHECVHSPYQGPDDQPVRKEGQVGDIRKPTKKEIPKAYREMMVSMDRGVGQIVSKLKELNLEESTLVLFFSDNGANQNGNNQPWKGFKGSLWEGGHRVPFIAWQPSKIKPGRTSDVPAMTMDVMPTLVDLTEATLPADHHLDGVSLAPILYDDEKKLAERPLFWAFGNAWAIRDGNWKLIDASKGRNSKPELYNLDTDPGETTDLAKDHPERVKEMTERYLSWRADIAITARAQPDE